MGVDRPIDITADQRKTVLALLARYLPNTTTWVYGSRANWTSRPQSDLDMVVFAMPEQNDRVAELREAFEESNLPFRVDLFVWDTVPEQFRKRIEEEHVVLVEKEDTGGDWQTATWGELASLEYGKALRNYRSSTGSYRVFGTNGPIGWHDEMLCAHSSVIIGRKGAYRGVHYSARPFFVIDTAFYLKPKVKMDVRWAYYQLLNQDINGLDSGSAIPSTRREDFYSLPVKIPPLAEQRAIAHILGTLDDKIELNRRMNETLEAMARALFKSWFVDFDPVRAKMEGRWRPGESLPGLPAHLYDLFPDRLVESELGPIPEGWRIRCLSEIATVVDCLHKRKPERQNDGPVLIQVFNVGPTGRLDFSDPYNVTENDYAEWTQRIEILPGDLVITKTGRVGAVGQMPEGYKAGMGRNMVGVRAISGLSSPRFLKGSLLSDRMRHEMRRNTNDGTILRSLHVKAIGQLREVLPPYNLVSGYEALVDPIHAKLEQNDVESKTLTTLRNTLLPKLVSGEIRVQEVKRFLSERAS